MCETDRHCQKKLNKRDGSIKTVIENGEQGTKQKKVYNLDENGQKIAPKQQKSQIQFLQSGYDRQYQR